MLPLILPLEFSLQALLVSLVLGEVEVNKTGHTQIHGLGGRCIRLLRPQGLRNLQGHLPHLGKLLGRLGLPEGGGTVAV